MSNQADKNWINSIFKSYSLEKIKQFLNNTYPDNPINKNSNIKNIFTEYYEFRIAWNNKTAIKNKIKNSLNQIVLNKSSSPIKSSSPKKSPSPEYLLADSPLNFKNSEKIYNEQVIFYEIGNSSRKKRFMNYYYKKNPDNRHGHPDKIKKFFIKEIEDILKNNEIYYINDLLIKLDERVTSGLNGGGKRLIRIGPKGGKYYMKGGKKIYIK